jgi:hypothetical protein
MTSLATSCAAQPGLAGYLLPPALPGARGAASEDTGRVPPFPYLILLCAPAAE